MPLSESVEGPHNNSYLSLSGVTPHLRGQLALVATAALVLVPGCFGPDSTIGPSSDNEEPQLAPFAVTLIDKERFGSEPSVALGPGGSVFVCGPSGLGFGSDLWVSADEGASFRYVGTRVYTGAPQTPLWIPYTPVIRSGGGDLGGGDCDVGVDAGGRAYLVDLWLGGVSIASSGDRGATWTGLPVSTLPGVTDRPWVLGGDKDEVFVTASWGGQGTNIEQYGLNMPPAGGIWVARSTDGGQTFPHQALAAGNDHRLGLNSNIAQVGDDLYVMYAKKVAEGRFAIMVAASHDRGASWVQRSVTEQDFYAGQCFAPFNIFPVIAADDAGGVYVAWAYEDPRTDRFDLFMAASADGGETWNDPVRVTDRPGTRAFPWIAAQGPGRVGLVWYETNATIHRRTGDLYACNEEHPADAAWHLHYAFSANALDVTPTFTDILVQPEPVHVGELGRPYAEVLQVRFTADGRAATAYVADVPEGKARPMFAIQSSH